MSEMEHIKGKLVSTNKTIDEFVSDVDFKGWRGNKTSCFEGKWCEVAFEINGKVYLIDKQKIYPGDDISESRINEDGTIDFEIRYYRDGCSFNEALGDAIKKGDTRE